MTVSEDNRIWATGMLSRFIGWRGFPETDAGLDMSARAFLRLVHNKTVREILESANCVPGREINFKIDPDMNDAEWILDHVAETMEYFPLPAQMREIYEQHLPPAGSVSQEKRS